MKALNNHCMILVLTAAAFLTACTGTASTSASRQDDTRMADNGYQTGAAGNANQSNIVLEQNQKTTNKSLSDMILQAPGVRLAGGQGASARFIISGMSGSFMAGTDPLFVVNGRSMGTDFSIVHASIHPNDVTSVTVLKGSDATIYGSRGANGVIVIRTKKR